ncbi:MAG: hypothetical protein U0470_05985 [Anaerolineae bacterium]
MGTLLWTANDPVRVGCDATPVDAVQLKARLPPSNTYIRCSLMSTSIRFAPPAPTTPVPARGTCSVWPS